MYYKLNAKPQRADLSRVTARIVLLTVGLLIGAVIGLYVAVRTLPLPSQQIIYVGGPNSY